MSTYHMDELITSKMIFDPNVVNKKHSPCRLISPTYGRFLHPLCLPLGGIIVPSWIFGISTGCVEGDDVKWGEGEGATMTEIML